MTNPVWKNLDFPFRHEFVTTQFRNLIPFEDSGIKKEKPHAGIPSHDGSPLTANFQEVGSFLALNRAVTDGSFDALMESADGLCGYEAPTLEISREFFCEPCTSLPGAESSC
jgi:hypothetical protein